MEGARDTHEYTREPVAQTLRVLWYNRNRIRSFVLAGIGAGLLLTIGQFSSAEYRAETTVTMLPSYSEILYTSGRSDFVGQNPALVLTQTQTEFLLSRSIARRLVEELIADGDIDTTSRLDVAYLKSAVARPVSRLSNKILQLLNYGRVNTPSTVDALTSKMRSGITVRNVPGSYILNIGATWTTPEIASKAANLLAHTYVENTREQNNHALMLTSTFIEERMAEENGRLREVEALIRDVKSGSPVYLSLSSETPLQLRQMEEYAAEKGRLEMHLLQLRAQIESCRLVGSFRDTVAASAEYAATQNALWRVTSLMRNRQKELDQIPELEYNLIQLEQRKQEIRQSLSALQQNRVQAGIAQTSFMNTVRVIDPAVVPVFPVGAGFLFNTVAAAIAGFLLALGTIVVVESFRRKVRSSSDMPSSEFVTLATFPQISQRPPRGWLGRTHPRRADESVVSKHSVYLAEEICSGAAGEVVLLDSVRGPSHHVDALTGMLRNTHGKVLVVNLDEPLHRALAQVDGDMVGIQTEAGAAHDRYFIFGESVTYVRPRKPTVGDLTRSDISFLEGFLGSEDASGFQTVIVIARGLRHSPLAPALSKLANRRLLLVESDVDSVDDLRYCDNRYRSVDQATATSCIITGVQYGPDYLFA